MNKFQNNIPIPQFAVCINNSEYPASLELHKIYRVLADDAAAKDGDLRIIDESGEDYLYPEKYFILIKVPKPFQETRRPTLIRVSPVNSKFFLATS